MCQRHDEHVSIPRNANEGVKKAAKLTPFIKIVNCLSTSSFSRVHIGALFAVKQS